MRYVPEEARWGRMRRELHRCGSVSSNVSRGSLRCKRRDQNLGAAAVGAHKRVPGVCREESRASPRSERPCSTGPYTGAEEGWDGTGTTTYPHRRPPTHHGLPTALPLARGSDDIRVLRADDVNGGE